jgi:hypothetical protein
MAQETTLENYDVKKTAFLAELCPICKEKIPYGVEHHILKSVTKYPFPHIIIHGNPLHVLIVYLDANFKVRGTEGCESIEIAKNSEVFSQLLRKWSNPF